MRNLTCVCEISHIFYLSVFLLQAFSVDVVPRSLEQSCALSQHLSVNGFFLPVFRSYLLDRYGNRRFGDLKILDDILGNGLGQSLFLFFRASGICSYRYMRHSLFLLWIKLTVLYMFRHTVNKRRPGQFTHSRQGAKLPRQPRLGFAVRSRVSLLTATSPNCIANPFCHSKLSIRLQ